MSSTRDATLSLLPPPIASRCNGENKMKKILSLMLVLVMVFSMLAMTACDKDEPKNDDTTTNTDEAFNYAKLDIKKYIMILDPRGLMLA